MEVVCIKVLSSEIAEIEPWFLPNYGGEILWTVPEDPHPPHLINGNGRVNAVQYFPTVWKGLIVPMARFAVTTLVGLYSLRGGSSTSVDFEDSLSRSEACSS